ATASKLTTEKEYGPCELIFDWKMPDTPAPACFVYLYGDRLRFDLGQKGWQGTLETNLKLDSESKFTELKPAIKPGTWVRTTIRLESRALSIRYGDTEVYKAEWKKALESSGTITLLPTKETEFMNLFVRELKEKK